VNRVGVGTCMTTVPELHTMHSALSEIVSLVLNLWLKPTVHEMAWKKKAISTDFKEQ